jgi:integrase/recombinase XerD
MRMRNPNNQRIKRGYRYWLKDAKGQSESTIDIVEAAIHRFETHTRFKDFKTFRWEQAIAFKTWLTEQVNGRTGERLSKATLASTLKALRDFFEWLSREDGFRSHVHFSDAAYFNLSANDTRIARAERGRPVPSMGRIRNVLSKMPHATPVQRRDRALVAFTLLTGARDAATASFRLKHIDIVAGKVEQDAREVQTKRRKTFTTVFFPVGDDVRDIVSDWVRELTDQHLFGPDDPLFPSTRIGIGDDGLFFADGLTREPWSNAGPIRAVFKAAFEAGDLPYFNPHSFRKTLTTFGLTCCRTPEDFKAWSQNLGHEGVLTTFSSYGQVPSHRQAEIIAGLGDSPAPQPDAATMALLVETARRLVRQAG